MVASNEIEIAAGRAQVWAVLADAHRYAEWVIGAQEVHDADADYPAVDTALSHRTGIGPLTLDDETRVVTEQEPDLLVLRAKLRPLGELEVTFRLFPSGAGTRLVMEEEPVAGLMAAVPGTDVPLQARNVLTLRRLKTLAEALAEA